MSLSNEYASYRPIVQHGIYSYRLGNRARMIEFAATRGLTNEVISTYYGMPPARQKGESYEDYKNRRTFRQHLVKYREHIYDYSAV